MKQVFGVLLLLAVSSCAKESTVVEALQPGQYAGQTGYRTLSFLHIAESFLFPKGVDFLSNQTQITKVDSIYTDGDGLEFLLNFGRGVVCFDGIKRSGLMHVYVTDTLGYGKGRVKLISNSIDSFQMFSFGNWLRAELSMEVIKIQSDSAKWYYGLTLTSVDGENRLETAAPSGLDLVYDVPYANSRTGIACSGKSWLRLSNGNVLELELNTLRNNANCLSRWNEGLINCSLNSETWKIDFDPYGNGACDDDFKVSKGKGLKLTESIFKAW